jgi:hypothetical protein
MTMMHCWWQILVAAIAYFALGAIWFNQKVFGKAWMEGHGIVMNEEDKKKVHMGGMMFKSFLCTLIITAVICKLCCAGCMKTVEGMCMAGGIMHCIHYGLLVGIVISAAISMTYIYLMKKTKAYIVDCGYHLVGSTLAAAILGLLGCC